jgi:hypothetical protein
MKKSTGSLSKLLTKRSILVIPSLLKVATIDTISKQMKIWLNLKAHIQIKKTSAPYLFISNKNSNSKAGRTFAITEAKLPNSSTKTLEQSNGSN